MMTAGVANVAAFEAQLVAQVVDSLAMYMMENARFMAERLHAEFPKEVMMSILYHVWDLVLWDQTGPVHSLAHPCPTPSLTRLIHSCPCRATHTCWEFVTSGVAYPAYEILRGVQPDPSGFLEILPSVTSKSCERE